MKIGKVIIMLLCCAAATTEAAATLYQVTQDVKVRRGAGTKFDTYYQLEQGDTVEQVETDGKWVKVLWNEKEGFIPARMLVEIPEDVSVPVEKSLDDVDPYEDLDPKTLAMLIGALGAMAGLRRLMEIRREKRKAARVDNMPLPALKAKPHYWYVCRHCNQKLKGLSTPNRAYCLKAETHEWINLGETGDNNYHCKHCNTTVLTAKTPRERDCPAGLMHTWTDLGPIGTKHFYCKDCGVTILAAGRPTAENCSHSELHSWAEL